MTENKNIYAEKALSQIPRLLSNLDRNPFSPTYGCFNREFWLTRTRDFPDAIAQFGTLSLSLIWAHKFPGGEQYYHNKQIKEWVIAGIKYWMKIQHKDGSYDEFYPNERGWAGPTGFLLYAILRSYELTKEEFDEDSKKEFFKKVKKSAWFLATREEPGVLANHHAMALLSIYQAYHHLKDNEKEFAKRLYGKFTERLNSFFGYCFQEGWCLEYDGVDPGYLSATVSFLSKMQKYSKDEDWNNKIQEIIDNAIEFSSYFFYPNGSYGGVTGSRQTLHFYAHGYELQSQNDLARACAEFGKKSLVQNKLVPPEIQGERYYLYRIPEFLEAHIGAGNKTTPNKLPFQKEPFEKYFGKAKIFIKNTDSHYMLLNLAKGGVLRIYDKKEGRLIFADDGVVATLKNSKRLTTQWIGNEYKIEHAGPEWVVYGNFHKIPYKYFNPMTFILFRLFMILTGWNAALAERTKGFIRNLLMTKSVKSPLSFERRFIFSNEGVEIMNLISSKAKVTALRFGGQFATRYVPQSRYFQQEELDNKYWDANSTFLNYLNTHTYHSLKQTFMFASQDTQFTPTANPLKIIFGVNGRAMKAA